MATLPDGTVIRDSRPLEPVGRFIVFDGIENARDMGGVPCADGRAVRAGSLLRSALLAPASPRDLERLAAEFDIKAVYDFRSEHETARVPDKPVPGAEYVNLPVLNTNGNLFKGMFARPGENVDPMAKMISFICGPASKMLVDGFYISFVDDQFCQEQYASFFRHLIASSCPHVLWHCSQGKDRTGLAAAFLLRALGADRETIIEDFDDSNIAYAEITERVKGLVLEHGGTAEDLEVTQSLLGVNTQWFIDALDFIDTQYGGLDSYLSNQLHVTSEDIATLRAAYLV